MPPTGRTLPQHIGHVESTSASVLFPGDAPKQSAKAPRDAAAARRGSGSTWGAVGCTERRRTASNCTRRRSTAPASTCGSSFRRSEWVWRPALHNCTQRQRTAVNDTQYQPIGEDPQVRAVRVARRQGLTGGCRMGAAWQSDHGVRSAHRGRPWRSVVTCDDAGEQVGLTFLRRPKWSELAAPRLAGAGCRRGLADAGQEGPGVSSVLVLVLVLVFRVGGK